LRKLKVLKTLSKTSFSPPLQVAATKPNVLIILYAHSKCQ